MAAATDTALAAWAWAAATEGQPVVGVPGGCSWCPICLPTPGDRAVSPLVKALGRGCHSFLFPPDALLDMGLCLPGPYSQAVLAVAKPPERTRPTLPLSRCLGLVSHFSLPHTALLLTLGPRCVSNLGHCPCAGRLLIFCSSVVLPSSVPSAHKDVLICTVLQ